MDQIRTFFAQVKKYHFWILCVVVVAVGITSWYMATGTLDQTAKKSAEEIKSASSKITQVKSIKPHPNAEFETAMAELIRKQSVSIGVGWQQRYAAQKDLLVWPEYLGEDFIEQVDELRPIEKYATGDAQAKEIPTEYLDRYRNYITDHLPNVAAIIGAQWYAKANASGDGSSSTGASVGSYGRSSSGRGSYSGRGIGEAGAEEEVDNSLVKWSESNQQEILDLHFGFASLAATPTTAEVLYAQEDLWVLEAVLNVIKRTNGDADANFNAPIKEIVSLQLGRSAQGRMGKVTPVFQEQVNVTGSGTSGPYGPGGTVDYNSVPGASSASSGGSDAPAASYPASGSSVPGASGYGEGTTGGGGTVDPALGRYVDVDYNPLPPKDLRDALTSQDPKLAIYSVAKRMPVRMRFFMDQRKLNDLLAECGNSSLPIEVRQVRINCPAGLGSDSGLGSGGGPATVPSYGATSGSSSGASSYGGASYPGAGGGSSTGSSRRSSGGSGMGTSGSMGSYGSEGADLGVDPNEIEIEVYGIVHVYNPVNEKQLNIELRQLEGDAAGEKTEEAPAETPESPTAVAPVAVPPRG